MTLGIVKRNEAEFGDWLKRQHAKAAEMLEGWGMNPRGLLSTEIGWLICLQKYEGKEIEFDQFQLGFLMSRSKMRSFNKSRQVGFSFGIATESLARCHLKEKHTAVCVSYNLDDAKEKIARVKELHDELPLEYQKKIITDSKTEVAFQSPGSKRKVSRVISYPSKAPRGKTGDVYLDELAHCQNDSAIYAGATALISRSHGQLTIGSTPLGQRGKFHDVHTESYDKYPGFERFNVPWWLCKHFSKITKRPDLVGLCATLPTEARVERYGTPALQDQFGALPIEDFQQEFECAFQDERVSFFPYDLILPCCTKESWQIPVYTTMSMLLEVAGKLGPLYAGFDVGRVKHPSELVVMERTGGSHIMRYQESFRDVPFPQQRARLEQIITLMGDHLAKFRIDSTGLGKNLAEDLQQKFGRRRVEQVDFTRGSKEELANNMKILLQERNLLLPKDRGLIAQIHSIKQKITSSGNTIFDAERNRRHHADKFWAIALAARMKRHKRQAVIEVTARVIGDKEKDEEPAKKKAAPAKGFVERLFTVPVTASSEPPEGSVVGLAAAPPATDDELARRSKSLALAVRVWRRSGDEARARELHAKYKRVRREIARRGAARCPIEKARQADLRQLGLPRR